MEVKKEKGKRTDGLVWTSPLTYSQKSSGDLFMNANNHFRYHFRFEESFPVFRKREFHNIKIDFNHIGGTFSMMYRFLQQAA